MGYICQDCGEKFSREWSLDNHIKHFHKLNFLCHLCGFETDDKQTSITHKRKHTQQYFECQHCDRKLKCRGSLLRHVREQHEVKKFSCKHCNYKTNREFLLNEHQKTHIGKPQVSSSYCHTRL